MSFNRDEDLEFDGAPDPTTVSPTCTASVPAAQSCGDPTCLSCDAPGLTPDLREFVFTCEPGDIPPGDYQDSWYPDRTHMAFWDHDELIVSDCNTGDKWKVLCYEQQKRASRHPFYTWYCKPLSPNDPADAEFLRDIGS